MLRYLILVVALSVVIPTAYAKEKPKGKTQAFYDRAEWERTGKGRHFAIVGCYRKWSDARRQARRVSRFSNAPMAPAKPTPWYTAYVINTSHYATINSGFKCVVIGPKSYLRARSICSHLSDYNAECFVKAAY